VIATSRNPPHSKLSFLDKAQTETYNYQLKNMGYKGYSEQNKKPNLYRKLKRRKDLIGPASDEHSNDRN